MVRNRIRVTNNVQSDNLVTILPLVVVGQPAVPAGGVANINQPAHTLVNQEILWPGAQNIPAGQPPRILCIAANGHVLQAQGGTVFLGGLGMFFDANGKSLAFLVEFNNFRYYIGGDIESVQEDGNGNNGIMHFLNPNNNLAGRIHAMKTSHHGSASSTSRAFVNRLQPIAAFISCGLNNQFNHPTQQVVNVLEGYGPNDYLANVLNPGRPYARRNPLNNLNLPIPPIGLVGTLNHQVENYYLTNARGYQNLFLGSGADILSGNQILGGHILLTVNEAQSLGQAPLINNNPNNFNVTYNHPPMINGNVQTTNSH